jgi:transposase
MADRFWLSDVQWAVIESLLPRLGGKPRVDDRRVISGILHRYREGVDKRGKLGSPILCVLFIAAVGSLTN